MPATVEKWKIVRFFVFDNESAADKPENCVFLLTFPSIRNVTYVKRCIVKSGKRD